MSIQSEIERINGNVASAYTALSAKGATMPSLLNTANLASAIESIQAGEAMSIETVRVICGWQANGLPVGYTLLEYIESTGTQYIDTGFKPNQDTRTVLDMQMTAENASLAANDIFGCRTAHSSKTYAVQWSMTYDCFQHFYGNGYDGLDFGVFGNRQIVDMNKNVLSLDGTTHERTFSAFQCDYSMFLCALNNAGTAAFFSNMRVYSCQVYDNGVLVRDFLPCINPSGETGLFDKVTKAFYGNAGTEEFYSDVNRPLLPAGYTQLEYIQSSGTQYIDTGFKPASEKVRIVSKLTLTDFTGSQVPFGAQTGSTWMLMLWTSGSSLYANCGASNSFAIGSATATEYDLATDGVGTVSFGLDGNVTTKSYSPPLEKGLSTYLFACNNSGSTTHFAKMRIYYFQIYDNGTLVRDFIPCINASGAYGLYDLVNAQFYANAGSGSFTGA